MSVQIKTVFRNVRPDNSGMCCHDKLLRIISSINYRRFFNFAILLVFTLKQGGLNCPGRELQ